MYDARHGQSGWNGKLAVKTAVADDHWTVEAAIPFADLGVGTPKAGETWLGNFCRDWRDPGLPSPSTPAGPTSRVASSLEPAKYGRLVFSDSTRGARLDLSPALNTGSST